MEFLIWLFELFWLLIKIILPIIAVIAIILFVLSIPSIIRDAKEKKRTNKYWETLKEKYSRFSLSEKEAIYYDLIKIDKTNQQFYKDSRRRTMDNSIDSLVSSMALTMQFENQGDVFEKEYGIPMPSEYYIEYDIEYLKKFFK